MSVLNQTYKNIEVIIVNDSTPDNSILKVKDVLKSYADMADKVRIVNHPINLGLANARNTGVMNATGDFIVHLDSDDFIETNTIECCIKTIIENKADAVVFGMRHIFGNGSVVEHIAIPYNKTDYINQLIKRKTIVCMCGGIYSRYLYTSYDVWAISGLNMGEDYSTKPRLLYNAKHIVALDMPLYNYNHTNEGSYTRTFAKKHIEDITKAVTVLTEFFGKKDDAELYSLSLRQAALSSKILLLKNWALAPIDMDTYTKIRSLYSDIPHNVLPSKIDKLILNLSDKGLVRLLRCLVCVGFSIKAVLKKSQK